MALTITPRVYSLRHRVMVDMAISVEFKPNMSCSVALLPSLSIEDVSRVLDMFVDVD